jgi:hypothetical protein
MPPRWAKWAMPACVPVTPCPERDSAEDEYEPLRLDREEEVHIDRLIRKHHSEREQHAVDAAGRPDRRNRNAPHHQELDEPRADHADEVECREAFGAPRVLQLRAKHPQGEHVEEDVAEPAVQESIGNELPGPEIRRS